MIQVHHGDCIEVIRTLPDNSVDSIVTDPPYGLGFMGKAWDALPPGEEWARECLRVLKPGGHLLAFGGTRTWHRLAVAVEDAGFEVRDSIAWMYGSGFPKSHDVSKGIDKAAGSEREVIGRKDRYRDGLERVNQGATGGEFLGLANGVDSITAPATLAAQQWEGWGTALKPAFEPVVVARKPFKGTVAANVQEWGTGALNIDACRIGIDAAERDIIDSRSGASAIRPDHYTVGGHFSREVGERFKSTHASGRWPANVALDEDMAGVLDGQSGIFKGVAGGMRQIGGKVTFSETILDKTVINPKTFTRGTPDEGGASRFFYVAKAPKKERPMVNGVAHATVKPLALMRWLVRLVTPEGGTVLEPFAGSGTTVEACILEGFQCIAIEREAEYLPLIQARIDRQAA